VAGALRHNQLIPTFASAVGELPRQRVREPKFQPGRIPMIRRLLCLGALLILLSASACNDTKPTTAPKTVPDPEGNPVPKPGGAKSG